MNEPIQLALHESEVVECGKSGKYRSCSTTHVGSSLSRRLWAVRGSALSSLGLQGKPKLIDSARTAFHISIDSFPMDAFAMAFER